LQRRSHESHGRYARRRAAAEARARSGKSPAHSHGPKNRLSSGAMSAAKAEVLRRLHVEGPMLVLPNAWDAGSARVFIDAGFSALATTSAGIAFSLGYMDGERISRDEMLSAVAR